MTIINVDLYFNYDLVEDNIPEKNISKKISNNGKVIVVNKIEVYYVPQ